MRSGLLCGLLLAQGCGMGPNTETLIQTVQVVSAINEPPEVAPLEMWDLSLTVADPQGVEPEVLVWSCLEDTCITGPVPLDESGQGTTSLVSVAPIPVWVLACDPSVCDLENPTQEQLQDPFSWMAELPIEGVSLALQPVSITEAPVEDRRKNPEITQQPEDEALQAATPDEPVMLEFMVPGASWAWGYSTDGGFGRPSWDVASDGAVTLEWYAPEEGDSAEVYVVFIDEMGGQALWLASWNAASE